MPDGLFSPDPEDTPDSDRLDHKDPREVSTIAFPYVGLDDAIETTRAIFDKGGVALSRDQLAGVMGQQPGSGNFSTKVAAARLFGLIESTSGKYQLTKLGFDILGCDETQVKAAMVRAFLNVPLYRRTYEEFRNGYLPPRPNGLEGAFAGFGVASKQTNRARRAFDNSARLAGFFEHGEDRLVEPIVSLQQKIADSVKRTLGPMSTDKGRDHPPAPMSATEHPFIQGLLISLPPLGEEWGATDRIKWLRAATTAFELMYKGGGPISIAAEQRDD